MYLFYGVGIYFLICIVFYIMQDYFFFWLEILFGNFKYEYLFLFDEVYFEMEDGGYINGLYFWVFNVKGVVFYFKGNFWSLKGWGKFVKDFFGKGYDFFMIDYWGFGKSVGKWMEVILYNDVQMVYKWFSECYFED